MNVLTMKTKSKLVIEVKNGMVWGVFSDAKQLPEVVVVDLDALSAGEKVEPLSVLVQNISQASHATQEFLL